MDDNATFSRLYDIYTAAASNPDPAERERLLRECATDDMEIISPFPYDVRGLPEVAEQLGRVAEAMPDGRLTIRRTSPVDVHHDYLRVTFENVASDGTRLSTGLHVIELRDGRISRIVVFVPHDLPTL